MSPATSAAAARNLTKFAWLSIAAAIVTIALKFAAYLMTGSVGLLSDAAESVVNLVAAVVALYALRIAAMPPDHNHHFGHSKAEYFSAWVEGIMIFMAAAFIVYTAVERLVFPSPIHDIGIGVAISVVAAIVNAVVGLILLRAARKYRSLTLKADGKHLMTDVWTTVGVVVGIVLVGITDWQWLDPVVALAVGLNILIAGYLLVRESTEGLMDISWTPEENRQVAAIVKAFMTDEVEIHALRTRQSGHQRFAEMHVLVPGDWSVWRGHDLIEQIESAVRAQIEDVEVSCHLEPIEDPRAYGDFQTEIALSDSCPVPVSAHGRRRPGESGVRPGH